MRLVRGFGIGPPVMTAVAIAALLGSMPAKAEAAVLLVANFCPGHSSCPTGVSASLTVDDNNTPAVNDYLITATFTGTASAPALLDAFSFTLGGLPTPGGYTNVQLQSAPGGVPAWQTAFDNVSNQANACTANTNQANEVCTNSIASIGTTLAGQTLAFRFLVDLSGTLTIGTELNLRAAFNNANGTNAGILSPDGQYTGGGGSGGGGQTIPEPMSLAMFGLAALGVARARRRPK
jgi:PEP-CTERM motif